MIYLRALHQNTSISVRIVNAKTKVAPLAGATIPRLELCGALLLVRLLSTVARDLNIPTEHLYAWCDSSAVLGWIKSAPSKMKTYVSNRVQKLVELVPPGQWRYVSINHNPADHASRGLSPRRLIACDLWWQGPAWLKLSPAEWPLRQDLDRNKTLPELKATALIVRSPTGMDLWNIYSTFQRLLTITTWCKRFLQNSRNVNAIKESHLTDLELESSRVLLLHLSQQLSYPTELEQLMKGKPIARSSSLRFLCPLLGEDGLLRVGGRIEKSEQSYNFNHPIILHKHSTITRLLHSSASTYRCHSCWASYYAVYFG